MVGKLRTKRDRSKIEEGASDAELEFQSAKKYLPGLNVGQFMVMHTSYPTSFLQERWLISIHRPLSSTELKQIKSNYENEAKTCISKAEEYNSKGKLNLALDLFQTVIKEYPFSSSINLAFLHLAEVLIKQGQFEKAKKELLVLLERFIQDEERANANYLLGTCYERQEKYMEAKNAYDIAYNCSKDKELKSQSQRHMEYCESRSLWPSLAGYEKIVWWLSGRKPEASILEKLIIKDEEIITKVLSSTIINIDFSLPKKVDFRSLIEASERARTHSDQDNIEKIKAEKWTQDQAPKLLLLIEEKKLTEAGDVARRIVSRLSSTGGTASTSVVNVLNIFNENVLKKEQFINNEFINLNARQFEFEIALLLSLQGYKVNITNLTGDNGVDVFATKDLAKIVVQCKRYKPSRLIGRSIVDELAGTAKRHSATRAILATTSSFSKDGIITAKQHGIELWDFHYICRQFKEYGR